VAAGEVPVERIILWGSYVPDDLDLARGPDRLRSAELILVRGVLDQFITEEVHARQEKKLEELGIPFETITHSGGHELDPAVLRRIAGVD
jgi:predicted esterase